MRILKLWYKYNHTAMHVVALAVFKIGLIIDVILCHKCNKRFNRLVSHIFYVFNGFFVIFPRFFLIKNVVKCKK